MVSSGWLHPQDCQGSDVVLLYTADQLGAGADERPVPEILSYRQRFSVSCRLDSHSATVQKLHGTKPCRPACSQSPLACAMPVPAKQRPGHMAA